MFEPFLKGFLLMGGLIIAIGAQNAFLLRQGLKREHVLPLVLFCSLSDALLATLGVLGLEAILIRFPQLIQIFTIGGVLFLLSYGLMAFRRAFKSNILYLSDEPSLSLKSALLTVFAFTYLNPHVYLDTVILVGSLANQYSEPDNLVFLVGGITASFMWFFSLGYGARILAPLFQTQMSWRILDIIIGIIMIALALSLVF